MFSLSSIVTVKIRFKFKSFSFAKSVCGIAIIINNPNSIFEGDRDFSIVIETDI